MQESRGVVSAGQMGLQRRQCARAASFVAASCLVALSAASTGHAHASNELASADSLAYVPPLRDLTRAIGMEDRRSADLLRQLDDEVRNGGIVGQPTRSVQTLLPMPYMVLETRVGEQIRIPDWDYRTFEHDQSLKADAAFLQQLRTICTSVLAQRRAGLIAQSGRIDPQLLPPGRWKRLYVFLAEPTDYKLPAYDPLLRHLPLAEALWVQLRQPGPRWDGKQTFLMRGPATKVADTPLHEPLRKLGDGVGAMTVIEAHRLVLPSFEPLSRKLLVLRTYRNRKVRRPSSGWQSGGPDG